MTDVYQRLAEIDKDSQPNLYRRAIEERLEMREELRGEGEWCENLKKKGFPMEAAW